MQPLLRLTLIASLFLWGCMLAQGEKAVPAEGVYRCLPCGSSCDTASYEQPGKCSHCNMELVEAKSIKHSSLKPGEICQYLKDHPGTVLLDVRTKEEFEGKANPNYGS